MTAPRPLGYWLTTVDRLLDDRFERQAESTGVSRAGWQLLARLRSGAVAEDAIEALPLAARGVDVLTELERLAVDGLTERFGGEWRLTDAGHARVSDVEARADEEIRDRLASVVTTPQYDELVATLEQIALELGWQPT
ncbi:MULTISPECIES: hypothetical protein [Nocardioides]|uniref:MarR family transcriptional regulator n=1 Tax=Nocardioides vastitatis TaxID=2568655 RepID=A0ABW0ZPQ2_9ACTN|nr:hypothetical protein [Nocardioides sp.]THI93252.1 hypothetical protein E7Z54_21115 [Nocardioides sp.]